MQPHDRLCDLEVRVPSYTGEVSETELCAESGAGLQVRVLRCGAAGFTASMATTRQNCESPSDIQVPVLTARACRSAHHASSKAGSSR